MKKKFTKLTLFITVLLLIFSITINVHAITPSNNKTTYSIGAKYSDINTTAHATYAHNSYATMGMSYTKLNTAPTASNLQGSHPNNVSLINSGIVYISGHANYNGFVFPNVNLLWQTYSSGNTVGIGSFNNNPKTALYVMGGCKTAYGNNSITEFVVAQGAAMAIGWTTDLAVGSYENWNKRFQDKIKDKTTSVYNAAVSADNAIYLNNNVKNWKIYGTNSSWNYNPWYFITGSTKASVVSPSGINLEANEYIIKNSSTIANNTISKSEVKNIAENYIKNKLNSNFQISDYVLEINGVDVKCYDYVLYVDGVRTNIGYTVIQEANGAIRV